MVISNFADLVKAGLKENPQQRLLFLFVKVEKSTASSGGAAHGALVPVICTDKVLTKHLTFAKLVEEADSVNPGWDMFLVSSLGSRSPTPPSEADADLHLQKMVSTVQLGGDLSNYLVFDRKENIVKPQAPN